MIDREMIAFWEETLLKGLNKQSMNDLTLDELDAEIEEELSTIDTELLSDTGYLETHKQYLAQLRLRREELTHKEANTINTSNKNISKTWKIPVTWEMYGIVEVNAPTIERAFNKVNFDNDDIPLPTDGDYVDGSFRCSYDSIDELKSLIEVDP